MPNASWCIGVAGMLGLSVTTSTGALTHVPRAFSSEDLSLWWVPFFAGTCTYFCFFPCEVFKGRLTCWLTLHPPEQHFLIINEDTKELLAYVGYLWVFTILEIKDLLKYLLTY